RQYWTLRAARDARVRDAATRAHEPHAAALAAIADRAFLAGAVFFERCAASCPLGHRASRPFHAAVLHRAGFCRRHCRAECRGLPLEGGVVRAALRIPISEVRREPLLL